MAERVDIQSVRIGSKATFELQISREQLLQFSELSGDKNPLHDSDDFAKRKGFKGVVCHGMLLSSYFSRLAGMYIPGENCLLQAVKLSFVEPVYINEECVLVGEVVEIYESINTIVLKAQISSKSSGTTKVRATIQAGILP